MKAQTPRGTSIISALAILHTGQVNPTTRRHVLEPAQRLAARLEATGDRNGARIIRALLKSHGSQRAMLKVVGKDLRNVHTQGAHAQGTPS